MTTVAILAKNLDEIQHADDLVRAIEQSLIEEGFREKGYFAFLYENGNAPKSNALNLLLKEIQALKKLNKRNSGKVQKLTVYENVIRKRLPWSALRIVLIVTSVMLLAAVTIELFSRFLGPVMDIEEGFPELVEPEALELTEDVSLIEEVLPELVEPETIVNYQELSESPLMDPEFELVEDISLDKTVLQETLEVTTFTGLWERFCDNLSKLRDTLSKLSDSLSEVSDELDQEYLAISEEPKFLGDVGIEDLVQEREYLESVLTEADEMMPDYSIEIDSEEMYYDIELGEAVGPLLVAGRNLPVPFLANAQQAQEISASFLRQEFAQTRESAIQEVNALVQYSGDGDEARHIANARRAVDGLQEYGEQLESNLARFGIGG